jgi:Flp pilus assembly protein CpaB
MSAELPKAGCGFRNSVYRNGVVVVLLVIVGTATAGWVVIARPRPAPETVEVLVAAKDLPVGTMLILDDLVGDTVVKVKKVHRGELPPAFVSNRIDLVDKKLSRPVRAGEMFNPQDLNRGGAITLPEGYGMVSLQVGGGNARFVGPGSRVNVYAIVRNGNKLYAFQLLVNMLVVAVDTVWNYDNVGATRCTVSFAVTEKQALILALAKKMDCHLELMLRPPSGTLDSDKDYDIDKVLKILSDDRRATGPPPGPLPYDEPREGPASAPQPLETAPAPRPVVVPIPPAGE